MQAVLALEFDAHHFEDQKSCLQWIEKSEYDYVLNLKGFRLKLRKKCTYLSGEPRKVFAFYSNLWRYPNLYLARPDPYVAILKKTGTEVYGSTDLPAPLPETVEKEVKRAEKQATRQEKEEKRREKRKEERRKRKLGGGGGDEPKAGQKKKIKTEPLSPVPLKRQDRSGVCE